MHKQNGIIMARKLSKSEFDFIHIGSGNYSVSYTSLKTGKTKTAIVTDHSLICAVAVQRQPRQSDMQTLKSLIKATCKY